MLFRFRWLSDRMSSLLLPSLIVVVLLAVVTWLLVAFTTLPGGWDHSTAGVKLQLFGFAGIAVITLFIGVVIVAILESVIYRAQQLNAGLIITTVERLEAQGILQRAEAAATVRRDAKSEVYRVELAEALVARTEKTDAATERRHEEHMEVERDRQ